MKLPPSCVALLVAASSTHQAFAKIRHGSFGKMDNFIATESMSYVYDYDYYPYAEDEEEVSIIEGLLQGCPRQVIALSQCYGNDQVALMHCANCAYEGLEASGEDCAELPMDYEACSQVCEGACNDEVVELYKCGSQLFCDDDGVKNIEGVYLKEE